MKITKKDIYKLINRDNDIYERIYVEYVTKITVYIDSIVRNKESAKDLSSEIFIKLPELVKDSYDFSKGDFEKWIFGVAKNKARDFFKAQKHTAYEYGDNCDKNNLNKENKFKIEELKGVLTIQEFQYIVLVYINGFTLKDVKKEMNVTMFTIRKIKNSALKKIKNYYLMHYYN